jgi:hypothetical protein
MDSDLQQLLMAWTSDADSDESLAPLLARLAQDATFRQAFVDEIALLGQLRAVQSGEPRFLEIEELLSQAGAQPTSTLDLESRVMESVLTAANTSRTSVPIKATSGLHGLLRPSRVRRLGPVVAVCTCLLLYLASVHYNSLIVPLQLAQEHPLGIDTSAPAPALPEARSTTGDLAVLSKAIGVEWQGEYRPSVGDSLIAGELSLRKGTVQLEFLSGVRLLIEGPAVVEMRAVDEVRLKHGLASCFVSEMGRGFRMLTSDMEVIDLGTAFSLDVREGQASEVHVLEGSVEIKSGAQETMELREQHAIRMSPAGPLNVAFAPERFPKPAALESQQQLFQAIRFEKWSELSRKLQSDPSLLLYFAFDKVSSNTFELDNRAQDPSRATSGVIIGCSWDQGRWPHKPALLYRQPTDRVLFQVAGAHQQLTFVIWARIDALTQPLTSLLMTEEPLRRVTLNPLPQITHHNLADIRTATEVRAVRWELFGPEPRLSLAVGYRQDKSKLLAYTSFHAAHDFPSPLNWGKWCCLAVTCDTETGRVIQYYNGQKIHSGRLKHSDPIVLDYMTLGNLSVSDEEVERSAGLARRRFYGAFDELLIAERILSDQELSEIYRIGQP